ncbi:MAG: haloacid dehalogenase type II [Pseudomonadota bacterium]
MTRPQAFLFDVFGTLVDWRNSVARAVAETLDVDDAHAFADAWRAEYAPAMAQIRSGARGYVSLEVLHLENLQRVLDAQGRVLDQATATALNDIWHGLDPWPDVVQGLYGLKTIGLIAPCSNASIAMGLRQARHGHLPWDAILGAEIAQSYKPDPEVYLSNCRALGLENREVMFVAAHNEDLHAAQACGLQTALLLRPTEHGPTQTKDLKPTGDWDQVVESLPELVDRLSA